ncbi:MAG: hypothetical protein BWY76_03375 [bacterium ADurb.Bin429]|nr:MAG: hypothetical protein BWY76_03375 [bacterium ADurb.Bin429]
MPPTQCGANHARASSCPAILDEKVSRRKEAGANFVWRRPVTFQHQYFVNVFDIGVCEVSFALPKLIEPAAQSVSVTCFPRT